MPDLFQLSKFVTEPIAELLPVHRFNKVHPPVMQPLMDKIRRKPKGGLKVPLLHLRKINLRTLPIKMVQKSKTSQKPLLFVQF
jgi:hypothetical protein